jgi:hypothetical protein
LIYEKRGLGIGDWGLGIGDWAQSPIPNPQSPIPFFQRKKVTIIINVKNELKRDNLIHPYL